ncbi:MAG: tyrosine-type recombinase/integrase [Pseudomonadota bacterium]|nr:tyrosine-type recombinase/integrase [Pseudomonadota bacterium]
MTEQKYTSETFHSKKWKKTIATGPCLFVVPHTEDTSTEPTSSLLNQFLPSARLIDEYLPSEKRRALDRIVLRLEESKLPGNDLVINHLHDKYCRNLATSTIRQSGEFLLGFLSFFKTLGKCYFGEITRKDIVAYVENQQDRGLKVASVRGKLATVYAFLQFLVDNKILHPDILYKKIQIKLPKALPKAIPSDDLKQLIAVVDDDRNRALILILLHTGLRIGELLNVKIADIILAERKILLHLGEKNFEGRVVFYSNDADHALRQWLSIRKPDKEYLFYGTTRDSLSYVQVWMIMRDYLEKAALDHKGYSLHSLRHTFATNMLNAGLPLEVLQQLLGHKCIEMTLRYGRMSNLTRETEYFKAMTKIEKGGHDEHYRTNTKLQEVFEKKKLLRPHR